MVTTGRDAAGVPDTHDDPLDSEGREDTGLVQGGQVRVCRGGEVRVCRGLTVAARDSHYQYSHARPDTLKKTLARLTFKCSPGCLKRRVPALEWVPKCRPGVPLLKDVVAGLVNTLLLLPHGLAFASMAGVSPVTGLYMSVFPVVPYLLLGTSRHLSLGTFFIPCLMMGNVAASVVGVPGQYPPSHNDTSTPPYTPDQVVATLAFLIGICQLCLGVTGTGLIVSRFLSDVVFSGFGASVSFHVFTVSLVDLLGLPVKRYFGPLKVFYTWGHVFSSITQANTAVLIISALCLATLLLHDFLLKPRLARVLPVVVPVEVVVMVCATVTSLYLDLTTANDVTLIGEIPVGFPQVSVPALDILEDVALIGFLMSNVIYCSNLRMAKGAASRQGYKIDPPQEFLAQGLGQVFGSFFSCGPMAGFLPRTLALEASGGASTVALVVSCASMAFVLFFVAPLFHLLPKCVLASITVASVLPVILQCRDLPKFWRESKHDALVWLVTFLVVAITDVPYGIMTGFFVSMFSVASRSLWPPVSRLGLVPHTDMYLDVEKYDAAVEVAGLRVVRVRAPLHFANADHLRDSLLGDSGLLSFPPPSNAKDTQCPDSKPLGLWLTEAVRVVVLDLTTAPFVDPSGARVLREVYRKLIGSGLVVGLVIPSAQVVWQLERCGVFEEVAREHVFHSTQDAVTLMLARDKDDDFSVGDACVTQDPTRPRSIVEP